MPFVVVRCWWRWWWGPVGCWCFVWFLQDRLCLTARENWRTGVDRPLSCSCVCVFSVSFILGTSHHDRPFGHEEWVFGCSSRGPVSHRKEGHIQQRESTFTSLLDLVPNFCRICSASHLPERVRRLELFPPRPPGSPNVFFFLQNGTRRERVPTKTAVRWLHGQPARAVVRRCCIRW